MLAPRVALAVIAGPYNDLATNSVARQSGGKGSKGYCIKDNVKAVVDESSSGVNVRGVFYMSASTPDFVGDLRITTFYGLDPNPASTELLLAGFDSAAPQAIFSNEAFEGASGTIYPADYSAVVTRDQLPGQFPGFDLSPFQGSISSIFYVFAGTVPSSDLMAVPEPGTLFSAIIAAAFMTAICKRRVLG